MTVSVAVYLAVAAGVWGPVECGNPNVTRVRLEPGVVARTYPGVSCRIEVNDTLWKQATAPDRCTILLHEVGHLTGHAHTSKGIMKPIRGLHESDPRCSRSRLHLLTER